ncbi:TPA: hypothetical protein ACOEHI_000575 [Enterobacter kobei]|uniref:hypothetical protein n=1 Tax=Enterobacter TaxID=547 RepID=UPI000D3A6059|nr:hypothetical protein [Enterobacter sp. OLF]PUB51555.1 hypothetical protein AC520_2321 [Enterobacter sp. OLF]
MSVKRYEWVACDEHSCHCDVVESAEGDMVDYEDYAALEARCAALAAELQTVKAMNDCLSEELRGFESDGAFEGPKMHLLWWQCETPNHDDFMAEVQAQGVEMFAEQKNNEMMSLHPDTHAVGSIAAEMSSQVKQLREFAEQIRKGVQS